MAAPPGRNALRVLHKPRWGRQRPRREIICAMSSPAHEIGSPSPWVRRWAALIRPGGRVLDVACGHGRHVRYLSSRGLAVVGVDRDEAALAALDGTGGTRILVADIEAGPRAFLPGEFGGVGVAHYLHRPPFPGLGGAGRSGGGVVFQNFALGKEPFSRPGN